jgi:hypothetical protein
MVAFGDVNLSEEPIRGTYSPGAGGWPTIRYFNKDTGYEGAPYPKKTSKQMCEELGDDTYMQGYITEMGSTSLCNVGDNAGCSEKEIDFAAKWKGKGADDVKAQLSRLKGMLGGSMKPELKAWLGQRISILTQYAASSAAKDEL